MMEMMQYRDALALAQSDAMESDPRVFVFGLDVPDFKSIFGSTKGLLQKFGPERCFGTPLSEDAMTGVALGAALCGLRPIHVHIRVDFLLLGMNQIANMISTMRYMSGGKLKVPLVIRAVIGRGWGQGPQHSKTLHSFFAHIPGLKVIMPSCAQDAYSLLRTAIDDDNPVICIEHRWMYDVPGPVDRDLKIPLGKAHILRPGADLTVVTTSWMAIEAMQAAEILARQGVQAEVIDVRSIAPLDTETIAESVRKTGRCIVADYDWTFCGFSAELAAVVQQECFSELKGPVQRIGFEHTPCPTTRPLENLFYPSAQHIVRRAESMFDLNPSDLSGEIFFSYENKFKGPF
ncbi:MAG: alpha-ketoacid dehydrogenase subunit beta [Bdellovibrionales bacterium]